MWTWTSSYIKRFIHVLNDGDVFTTQDLLQFGNRTAVDQTLKRCVAKGFITRVARGVFMRTYNRRVREVTPEEIARIKAKAFGKSLLVEGDVFRVDGRSSSFRFGDLKIQLKERRRRVPNPADGK